MGTRLRLRSRWVILVATLPAATAQAGCGSGNQTGCPAKVQAAYIPAGTFPLVMVAKGAGIFPPPPTRRDAHADTEHLGHPSDAGSPVRSRARHRSGPHQSSRSRTMEIVVAAWAAVWPVIVNTIGGVQAVHPRLHEVGAVLRLTHPRRVRTIVLPAAAPLILVGGRLALSIVLIVAVVVEMIGNPSGLRARRATRAGSLAAKGDGGVSPS